MRRLVERVVGEKEVDGDARRHYGNQELQVQRVTRMAAPYFDRHHRRSSASEVVWRRDTLASRPSNATAATPQPQTPTLNNYIRRATCSSVQLVAHARRAAAAIIVSSVVFLPRAHACAAAPQEQAPRVAHTCLVLFTSDMSMQRGIVLAANTLRRAAQFPGRAVVPTAVLPSGAPARVAGWRGPARAYGASVHRCRGFASAAGSHDEAGGTVIEAEFTEVTEGDAPPAAARAGAPRKKHKSSFKRCVSITS